MGDGEMRLLAERESAAIFPPYTQPFRAGLCLAAGPPGLDELGWRAHSLSFRRRAAGLCSAAGRLSHLLCVSHGNHNQGRART